MILTGKVIVIDKYTRTYDIKGKSVTVPYLTLKDNPYGDKITNMVVKADPKAFADIDDSLLGHEINATMQVDYRDNIVSLKVMNIFI